MTITSIRLATECGTVLANDFLEGMEAHATKDNDTLYNLIYRLTHRKSGIDNAVLKALLNRVQNHLEARYA